MKLRLLGILTLTSVLAASGLFGADNHSPSATLTPLYTFLGGADGASPNEVILDPAGNLYGASLYGGNLVNCGPTGCGVVFKVDTRGRETVPYAFTGDDGAFPVAGVLRSSNGVLYGTNSGNGANGGGSAFSLRPHPTTCAATLCSWIESVIHGFGGGDDGSGPSGNLIQDTSGNLYGTTSFGGGTACNGGCGTVFRIDPHGNYFVLYSFAGGPNDGASPFTSLLLDAAGNLYGTTADGGTDGFGTVFKLSPNGSGWSVSILYNFTRGLDGGTPDAGLIADANGNLYGTTTYGGVGEEIANGTMVGVAERYSS